VNRRYLLKVCSLGLGTVLAGASAKSALAEVNRHARPSIVDANLVGFETPDGVLSSEVREALRRSGLTLAKVTLNGGGTYDAAKIDIKQMKETVTNNTDLLALVSNAADLSLCAEKGKIGVILSFESVEMLDGKLDLISQIYGQGVRVMQLSYNGGSVFSSGALSAPPSTGLTPLGHEAVALMNQLGMTLDVSHSDEKAVQEVALASKRPVIASHTGCAAIYPHPRNKSDEALRAISDTGGVVGIYTLAFLAPGPGQPTLRDYLAHLYHALDVCGEDHVGIGTDNTIFPFVETTETLRAWKLDYENRKALGIAAPDEDRFPFVQGLNGPDRYSVIAENLKARGFGVEVVAKVLGKNFERDFRETWQPPPL
jgi:membrane dipeptidase